MHPKTSNEQNISSNMERHDIKLLIVNDDDMNCDSTKDNIENMSIAQIGFSMKVLNEYDEILYMGKKGAKILKSRYGVLGIVK